MKIDIRRGWNSTLGPRRPIKRKMAAIWPKNRAKVDSGPKHRKPIKKASKSSARETRAYLKERAEWLKLPKNVACAICLCLDQTPMAATECHHSRGRIGRLLRDQRFWIPSCRGCRQIPHERPAWAREMGLLSSAGEWNVFPVD